MTRWLSVAVAALAIQPPAAHSVWVLQASDQIIDFEPATFAARRIVDVPALVTAHPEYLAVSAAGQLLYALPSGLSFGDTAGAENRVWLWDGKAPRSWARGTGPDTARQWFLSAAGDGLFALESRHTVARDRDGVERSIRTATRLLATDLSGGNERELMSLPDLPACACDTGACEETCPIWTAWAPDGVLGDFFVATRFVEGQLQPDFQESAIYRRQGARWVAGRLTNPVEAPLAASRDASLMAAAVYDAGCCGWINESSDLLHLLRGAAKTTIYDEWARFNNRNYDASFPVANARFNPAATLLAYTIGADAPPSGEEIRLSADGKPDAAELARIRAAAADHPWVEIVDAQSAAAKPVVIRHAELAGWLDAERVLVVENGRLVVYDRAGANRRDTGVEVRRAADVFVR